MTQPTPNATPAAQRLQVGLTGGIGSGKTRVATAFAERGVGIIDTDVIARELTAAGGSALPAITAAFGPQMITPTGAMNRSTMRELIFSDATQKKRLEAILHPLIRNEVIRRADQTSGSYLMIVVPLLIDTSYWNFSHVVVVDCDSSLQMQRVMQRDGLSQERVQSIIAQQATRQQRLALASEVLINDGAFEKLIPEIERLHQIYLDLSASNETQCL